jgi:hypothetical protein
MSNSTLRRGRGRPGGRAGGGASNRVVYISAFKSDHTLWLLGVDSESGQVVSEFQRSPAAGLSPNFVNVAWFEDHNS